MQTDFIPSGDTNFNYNLLRVADRQEAMRAYRTAPVGTIIIWNSASAPGKLRAIQKVPNQVSVLPGAVLIEYSDLSNIINRVFTKIFQTQKDAFVYLQDKKEFQAFWGSDEKMGFVTKRTRIRDLFNNIIIFNVDRLPSEFSVKEQCFIRLTRYVLEKNLAIFNSIERMRSQIFESEEGAKQFLKNQKRPHNFIQVLAAFWQNKENGTLNLFSELTHRNSVVTSDDVEEFKQIHNMLIQEWNNKVGEQNQSPSGVTSAESLREFTVEPDKAAEDEIRRQHFSSTHYIGRDPPPGWDDLRFVS